MAAGDVDVKLTRSDARNAMDVTTDTGGSAAFPCTATTGEKFPNGMTISVWARVRDNGVNLEAIDSTGIIMAAAINGGEMAGWMLTQREADDKMGFWLFDNTYRLVETTAITYGVWTHYLITISGATPARGYMYKNGAVTGTPNFNLTASLADIASAQGYFDYMTIGLASNCSVRQVKMWNRVLTAAEIAQDYAEILVSDGLIHHYKFEIDKTDAGSLVSDMTGDGEISTIDGRVSTAIKAQRGADTDKWLLVEVADGQEIASVNIREA